MKSSLFFQLFPVPKNLQWPAFGLDISDRSIKYASLKEEASLLKLESFGEVPIPAGLIEGGKILNLPELKNLLKDLSIKTGANRVVVSLPEDRAYNLRLSLPPMKQSELRQSIEFQLEENVPLPVSEVVFDYQVVAKDKKTKGIEVVVSALPKEIVNNYLEVLENSSLKPIAFEIEAQAMARSLVPRQTRGCYLIVDIGKIHTGFSVVDKNCAHYTSIINNISGEAITKNIQKELAWSYTDAERAKNELGLSRLPKDKNLFYAIVPMASALKDEIEKRYLYWNGRHERTIEEKIRGIILCGGQAGLPGLADYLQAYLDVPIKLGNPWINICHSNNVPPLSLAESLRYATALGLAMRPWDKYLTK